MTTVITDVNRFLDGIVAIADVARDKDGDLIYPHLCELLDDPDEKWYITERLQTSSWMPYEAHSSLKCPIAEGCAYGLKCPYIWLSLYTHCIFSMTQRIPFLEKTRTFVRFLIHPKRLESGLISLTESDYSHTHPFLGRVEVGCPICFDEPHMTPEHLADEFFKYAFILEKYLLVLRVAEYDTIQDSHGKYISVPIRTWYARLTPRAALNAMPRDMRALVERDWDRRIRTNWFVLTDRGYAISEGQGWRLLSTNVKIPVLPLNGTSKDAALVINHMMPHFRAMDHLPVRERLSVLRLVKQNLRLDNMKYYIPSSPEMESVVEKMTRAVRTEKNAERAGAFFSLLTMASE